MQFFDSTAQNYTDAVFCKVDIDDFFEISNRYQVKSVPTTIAFIKGTERARKVGLCSRDQLTRLLDSAGFS